MTHSILHGESADFITKLFHSITLVTEQGISSDPQVKSPMAAEPLQMDWLRELVVRAISTRRGQHGKH